MYTYIYYYIYILYIYISKSPGATLGHARQRKITSSNSCGVGLKVLAHRKDGRRFLLPFELVMPPKFCGRCSPPRRTNGVGPKLRQIKRERERDIYI
jgi:hypothetical protein